MRLVKIRYSDLNARQKEIYQFQKFAAILADFGFNCIKLADDWLGADFIAYHKDGRETLRVQLKSRLTVDEKYVGKDLWIAFPFKAYWYLVKHDVLVERIKRNTNWLNSESWRKKGIYHSTSINTGLQKALVEFEVRPE